MPRITVPAVAIGGLGRACRDRQRALRDLGFREAGAARHLLDGGAIEIAGGEIHVAEGAAGTQHFIDWTDRLEELAPVDVGDQAHAGDDVAHRDVGRALELVFLAHQLVGVASFADEPLFQPADGRCHLGILVA